MSFANSAAALKGMIEAEDSKEKQPAAECSTCALIRCDHVLFRQNYHAGQEFSASANN